MAIVTRSRRSLLTRLALCTAVTFYSLLSMRCFLFSYHLTIDSPIRKHCKDNIEICAWALNCAAMQKQLPAILHVMARHRRKVEDVASGKTTQEYMSEWVDELVRLCNQLSKLRIKANFQHNFRMKHPPSQARIELDRKEWRSGIIAKPQSSGQKKSFPWEKTNLRDVKGGGRIWPRQDVDRAKSIVEVLQTEFAVKLPHGEDGCPWFCHPSTMPENWSWAVCSTMMGGVYYRMKEHCSELDIVARTRQSYIRTHRS